MTTLNLSTLSLAAAAKPTSSTPAPRTSRNLTEAYMATHGYGLADLGRRPRTREHAGHSNPLARMQARGAYLPGC